MAAINTIKKSYCCSIILKYRNILSIGILVQDKHCKHDNCDKLDDLGYCL